MKKRIAALLACLLAVMMLVPSLALEIDYGSLSDTELDDLIRAATLERGSRQIVHEPTIVNASPDKYTWYVQDYVGRNAAGFGYTSLGGDRRDEYGKGNIKLNLVADDGAYLDPENIDLLKQYIVVSQDIAPNSVMRLTFLKDSDGEEYSNLVDSQTYQGITLYVHKLDISNPETPSDLGAAED